MSDPKKMGYSFLETLVERLDWINSDRTEPIRGNHGLKVESDQSEKKRDILLEICKLGGWEYSDPRKMGYSFLEMLVERLEWMNSDRTEPFHGNHG